MRHSPPLPRVLWDWYKGLGLLRKVFYPVVFLLVYVVSVLVAVSGYWLKTDHGYNLLTQGGWHAFSRCLVEQIPVPVEKMIRQPAGDGSVNALVI